MQKIKQFEMDDVRGVYFRVIEGDEIDQVVRRFLTFIQAVIFLVSETNSRVWLVK